MKRNLLHFLLVAFLSSLVLFSCNNNASVKEKDNEVVASEKDYFNYAGFEFSFTQKSTGTLNSIVHSSYEYKTIDQNGAEITCSGWYEYKLDNELDGFDLIIVDCHGTIMDNASCPSEKGASFNASVLGSKKVMIIAPDYLGYGSSSGAVHPYCVAELNARNIIDSVLSIKLKTGYKFSENCKTLIMGYSQGGQTSLATYKCIQDCIPAEYKSELNVQKVYSGAGPYNLLATMDEYLSSDSVIAPFIYFVVKAYLSVNYDSLKEYDIDDFFTTEFLNNHNQLAPSSPNMRESIDALNYSMSLNGVKVPEGLIEAYLDGADFITIMKNPEYQQFILANSDTVVKFIEYYTYSDITKLVTPQFLDPSSKMTKAFKEVLKQNNIAAGWKPEIPVYIYHHVKDDMVPFKNFEMLKKGMKGCNNIIFDKDEQEFDLEEPFDFVHRHAGAVFYQRVIDDINENF